MTHCPLLKAAAAHPEVCDAECHHVRKFFPEFLVTLESSIARNDAVCIFVLSYERSPD
ncbi:MAG: hypothetical protein AB7J35_18805 [Dehalococcoidia bacterium]